MHLCKLIHHGWRGFMRKPLFPRLNTSLCFNLHNKRVYVETMNPNLHIHVCTMYHVACTLYSILKVVYV